MRDEENNINLADVDNTAKIDTGNNNEESLFPANNLYKETADNLALAEAMVDEKPLRTEKTAELERREREENQ